MSEKSTNRRLNIWVNGKEVENNVRSIGRAISKLRAEMANAEIGSKKYEDSIKRIGQLNNILDKHKEEVRGVSNAWKDFSKMALASFGGNLMSELSQGILMKVSSTFKQLTGDVVDFQKEMTNVYTLLTDDEMAKFGDKLKQGATAIAKTGIASKDVTTAMYDALQAGQSAETVVSFLQKASVLAVGSVTSLATSVNGLTTVMNSYKLSAEEAGNVADAFYSAQKAGKTTSEELSDNIGKAAPIASSLAVSYQELLSATAALTNGGISTTESITNLKALFSNLLKPTGEAEKILTKLGIPFGATAVKAAGFTNVLQKLSEATQKYPDDVARAITSVDALTVVTALSGKGFDEYTRVLGIVNTDVGENSALQRSYAMQMETTAMLIARNKEELQAQRIEVGEKLQPVLLKIIEAQKAFGKGLLNTLDFISRHQQSIATLAKVLTVLISAYGAYYTITKLLEIRSKALLLIERGREAIAAIYTRTSLALALAQAKLSGNTTRAAAAQKLLNTAMSSNPVGLLISAVTALATAIMLFRDNTEEAAIAQENLNEMQKKAVEITNTQTSLQSKTRMFGMMNKEQLDAFITDAQSQIKALEDLKIELLDSQSELIEYQKKQGMSEEKLAKYTEQLFQSSYVSNFGKLSQEYYDNKAFLQKAIADAQNQLKELNTKTGGGTGTGTSDARTNALKEHANALDQILKRIRDQYADHAKSLLSEREKELFELRQKYKEEERVIDEAIAYYEEMQKKGIKLTKEEADNLAKFHQFKLDAEKLYQVQRSEINKKFNEKEAEERADAEQQIYESLLEGKEREINEVTKRYQTLLELAEKYKLDTTDIYAQLKKALAEIDAKYAKKTDIFGMTEEDWTGLNEKLNIATTLAGNLQQAFSNYHQMLSKQEAQAVHNLEVAAEEKTAIVDKQLERGIISEKSAAAKKTAIEQELDKKKAEIAREQAEREKNLAMFQATIDYASGIINIWSKYAANPIAAIGLTAALTGVYGTQMALINEAEVPAFYRGGYVQKPTYATLAERGPELVVNNDTIRNPATAPLAHALANAQNTPILGYTPPARGANYPSMNSNMVENYLRKLIELNSQPFRGYITNTDLTNHQDELNMLDKYGKM